MTTATLLTVKRIAAMRAAAHAAYAASPERATYAPVKVSATIDAVGHRGLDDRSQPTSRRRRAAMAYRTTCALLGIPTDAVWLPCYIGKCDGQETPSIVLHDAWTMDADHVDITAGSHPHNLMLACSTCNTLVKGDRPIHDNARAAIVEAGTGLGYVQGGVGLKPFWTARPRRSAGGNFSQGRRYGA